MRPQIDQLLSQPRRIHMLGIGGIGMAGLAFLVSAIALAGSGAFPLVLARLARRDGE